MFYMQQDFTVYNKRYGKEIVGLWEFITPLNPAVKVVAASIKSSNPDNTIWAAWDWVCRNVEYPPRADNANFEITSRSRFICGFPLSHTCDKVTNNTDFWQFPFETLAIPRYGDCDDKAFALTSILIYLGCRGTIACCVGTYLDSGHAWVDIKNPADNKWYVLETTASCANQSGLYSVLDQEPYESLIKFDDEWADEIQPGYEKYLS